MPIIEWRCENCGAEIEKILPIQKDGPYPEPEEHCCDARKLKRIIGKVSVNKGASWGLGKGHW